MRNLRSVIFGLSFLIGGVFLANLFGAEAGAQEQTVTEAQSWEIHTGHQSSGGTDSYFYVVRHNRMTGETQYIGCEEQNECEQLSVEIQ